MDPFTKEIIFTDPETAEMVKHATNAYLAIMIAFTHEIGRVSKIVGADPQTISRALLTERRVSPHAPLQPGPSWGGEHLARDVQMLMNIAHSHGIELPMIEGIHISKEIG